MNEHSTITPEKAGKAIHDWMTSNLMFHFHLTFKGKRKDGDRMADRDSVIKDLNVAKRILCNPQMHTREMCIRIGQAITSAIAMLKEQEAVETKPGKWIYGEDETGADGWRCSECGFFEPWFYEFTDDIDFIRFYGFCPGCGRKMASYTGKPTQECR